ncbi:MAG: nicotinamide mononucleotide transporter [Bdellovibrio sp.]
MILMAHRRIECWIYWVIVNLISIWLYATKGVMLISLLYVLFLVLAIFGWRAWTQERASLRSS